MEPPYLCYEIIAVVSENLVNFGTISQVFVETETCLSGCGRLIVFSVGVLTFCILGCVGCLYDKYRCLFTPLFGPARGRADEWAVLIR
jgi:hypothetical protein